MADSVDMAAVLMLLSRGRRDDQELETKKKYYYDSSSSSCSRVFECKTCNRQFPSFQALGGHRASHKKLRLMIPEAAEGATVGQLQQKVHECSICGQEFAIGQALGGHMRRHRPPAEGSAGIILNVGAAGEKRPRRVWNLDLNLPPSMSMEADEMECRKMGFGLEIVEPPPPIPM